jgi:CheY-like chemotaxis protein
VVDDNDDPLKVTSAKLTALGYRVDCARNGAEAIEIFRRGQQFGLLLSDVVMPNGMNGVELAREARRLNESIGVRGRCAGTTSSRRRVSDHRQTVPPRRLGAASAFDPARNVIIRSSSRPLPAHACPVVAKDARRTSSLGHVFSHARLSDRDAEFQKLSMHPRRSPRGVTTLISRISLRISGGTGGRPPRGRDFQHQYKREPARCHLMTVAGLIIASASRTQRKRR